MTIKVTTEPNNLDQYIEKHSKNREDVKNYIRKLRIGKWSEYIISTIVVTLAYLFWLYGDILSLPDLGLISDVAYVTLVLVMFYIGSYVLQWVNKKLGYSNSISDYEAKRNVVANIYDSVEDSNYNQIDQYRELLIQIKESPYISVHIDELEETATTIKDTDDEEIRKKVIDRNIPKVAKKMAISDGVYQLDQKVNKNEFISESCDDEYIDKIREETNTCYRYGAEDSACLLSRRIIESNMVELFRQDPNIQENEYTYKAGDNIRTYGLENLCSEFQSNMDRYKRQCDLIDGELIRDLNYIHQNVSPIIHSGEKSFTDDQISELSKRTDRCIEKIDRLKSKM